MFIKWCRHCKSTLNGQEFLQLVLPPGCENIVFQALHDDLWHQGRVHTTSLIKQRFFWPGMDSYIKSKVKSCDRFIRSKTNIGQRVGLIPIESSAPMEIVCIDYLSLEPSKGGIENILFITDHFTRYALIIPTRNQTARTAPRVLFDNFIVHYGFPASMHSDQGQCFESNLIKELCTIANVEKSRTTPYHPMGNEQVEKTIKLFFRCLEPWRNPRRVIGKCTFHPLCMHTTRHFMIVQGTPLSFWCLEDTHVKQ